MSVNHLFRTVFILALVLIDVSFVATAHNTEEFKPNNTSQLDMHNLLAELKTKLDADEILAL